MIIKKQDAVFDTYQLRILDQIGPFTGTDIFTATRGHETALGQLKVIYNYAHIHDCIYSEFEQNNLYDQILIDNKTLYKWQRSWSELLHKGIIINPPVVAECLFDYYKNGINKKGQFILPSPHIIGDPCPIDFSGKINGISRLAEVAAVMRSAKVSGVHIYSIQVEIANNCVHLNLMLEEKKNV